MPSFTSLKWLGLIPNRAEDLVAIGDEVDVKIIKIDEKRSLIDASMKALLPRPPKPEHAEDKGDKGHRHRVLVTTTKIINLGKTLPKDPG